MLIAIFNMVTPSHHGEMDCLRRAGRRPRYTDLTLYTTLSPCMMCAGAILQVALNASSSARMELSGQYPLPAACYGLLLVDDPSCYTLMQKFIAEHPDYGTNISRGIPMLNLFSRNSNALRPE